MFVVFVIWGSTWNWNLIFTTNLLIIILWWAQGVILSTYKHVLFWRELEILKTFVLLTPAPCSSSEIRCTSNTKKNPGNNLCLTPKSSKFHMNAYQVVEFYQYTVREHMCVCICSQLITHTHTHMCTLASRYWLTALVTAHTSHFRIT